MRTELNLISRLDIDVAVLAAKVAAVRVPEIQAALVVEEEILRSKSLAYLSQATPQVTLAKPSLTFFWIYVYGDLNKCQTVNVRRKQFDQCGGRLGGKTMGEVSRASIEQNAFPRPSLSLSVTEASLHTTI